MSSFADRNSPGSIHLRPAALGDVGPLFEIQLDPEGNALAGTKPRDRAAFEALWSEILRDNGNGRGLVIPRVIIADHELVGSISIFPHDGDHSVGYWIHRAHWGRGIASRALSLLLAEVSTRPLFARVVVHNPASRRALEKNGFVVIGRGRDEETDRYLAAEYNVLRLP